MFKKRDTKVLCLILSIMMVLMSFIGCAPKSQSSKKVIKIGVSTVTSQNSFFTDINKSMQAAMKTGDKIIINDANYNQAKQLNDVEDMIQQKCDAILIAPVDSKGVKHALEACKNAKIPVIVFNSPVNDENLVTSTVVSDNKMAGKLCAQALAKKLNNKGNIVEYDYSVTKVCKDRQVGFEDEMKNYADIKIVNKQEGKPTTDAALPIMENMLQSNPDIQGVFTINDPAAVGCVAAIESAHKLNQISIVSIDGSDQCKKMIQQGKMLGSAAQYPKKMGQTAVETAYKVISNQKVEKNINIPVEFVDKANIK